MTLIGILFSHYLSEFFLFKVKNYGTNWHYVWPQSRHKSSENHWKSRYFPAKVGVIFSHSLSLTMIKPFHIEADSYDFTIGAVFF